VGLNIFNDKRMGHNSHNLLREMMTSGELMGEMLGSTSLARASHHFVASFPVFGD